MSGNKYNKIEIKTDCFAYNERSCVNKCDALNRLYCRSEICKFYKPKEQYAEEVKKYGKAVADN